MTRLHFRAAALGAATLAAVAAGCGKGGPQDLLGALPGAQMKFFNFGVGAPGVDFYGNSAKLTGASSTSCTPPADTTAACRTVGITSTAGTAVGAAAVGGYYVGVAPGQYAVDSRSAAAADSGRTIATVAATVAAGNYYSYYVSGIYNAATRTADAFVVQDPLPATVDPTVALVRFVNAISNAPALSLVARDTATKAETVVGAGIAYKSAGAFVPVSPTGSFTLNVRNAAATNVITLAGQGFSPGRVYTVSARGDITVTSTTSANRPQLNTTPNY